MGLFLPDTLAEHSSPEKHASLAFLCKLHLSGLSDLATTLQCKNLMHRLRGTTAPFLGWPLFGIQLLCSVAIHAVFHILGRMWAWWVGGSCPYRVRYCSRGICRLLDAALMLFYFRDNKGVKCCLPSPARSSSHFLLRPVPLFLFQTRKEEEEQGRQADRWRWAPPPKIQHLRQPLQPA